ncbi:MAG: hypothetical protein Q4E75_02040 [bacterium]|nr:hypothetical protein [bacterium]
MEKDNNIKFKTDDLGIIPVNSEKQRQIRLKELIKEKDLSNPENRKKLDELIKNNDSLMEGLKSRAFNEIMLNLIEGTEFHTSEYLRDRIYYFNDYLDDFDFEVHECYEEYYKIESFIEPFEKYKSLVDSQINILEKKSYTVENENQGQRIDGRIRLLEIDSDDLDSFVNNLDEFEEIEDKLTEFIENHKYDYVDINSLINSLFVKVKNDPEISNDTKRMILSEIVQVLNSKYAKKQNPEEETKKTI